ncbi:MAG TPA: asparagine synthase (glutamine-hydrolyzing) [Steroidobacteraceae bacterium]|nr:asparagine synthase (glutamine-hydrolyzing) [Steroidobacteraceae bacterium]
MCGIVGFVRIGSPLDPGDAAVLARMTGCLAHRGPDADGAWLDAAAGVALGHRRLAIIELSAAGAQPMASPSGRHVIVFNGEIYNHLEIRAALSAANAAPAWRGHSDTETLLAAIEHFGLENALRRARGMFAFAAWDRETRRLTLARDRLGEKPLYYGRQGNVLLFGSELKSLRAHPAFAADVDRDAVAGFARRGYVAAPASIYRGIAKLPPGATITFDGGVASEPRAYWSLRDVAAAGLASPFAGDEREAEAELDRVLGDAVLEQTIADVPLGAFLSGGVDSSTVVALLRARTGRPVRTFTIGFREPGFDESPHAAAVAAHLGTEHSQHELGPRDALDIVPRLATLYDEPFGDSSAIPTHLVSTFARRHVTVCLSGDGGDELFGGYARYASTASLWNGLQRVPRFARGLLANGVGALARGGEGSRAQRLARYLAARDGDEVYRAQTDLWSRAGAPVPGGAEARDDATLPAGDLWARMMFADSVTYLPDDILAKVDRAAMAVSLETRVPLLDPRVVELAWRLPLALKVRDGEGKWLLKRVLARYVPDSIMRRPKMGFGVPVGQWLRGPLRDWAETLLAEPRLRAEGYFDAARVRALWSRHLGGVVEAADTLWPVLMFQAWLAETRPVASVAA